MIGFVVAMEKEGKLFLNSTQINNSYEYAGKKIFLGTLADGREFALILSGIGKVNAGISTQILIDKYQPEFIINFGVAGGKENSGLSAGDNVIISEVCQYDFDLSEIDNVNIGYMQDYDLTYYPTAYKRYVGNSLKVRKGASADRFTNKYEHLQTIKSLGAEVVDMECGAIAQTAYTNKTPLFILKLISDVDGSNDSIFAQYTNNVSTICNKIPMMIEELLNNI